MMSKSTQRHVLAWAAAVFLSGLLFACETNTASLMILQNQIPGESCVVDSSESAEYRTQGTLDVSWHTDYGGDPMGYVMFPLVKNNMLKTEDLENGVIEQNCLILQDVKVDLDLGALGGYFESGYTSYRVGTSGTICPGEMRAISVVVIPPQVVEALGPLVGQQQVIYAEATIRVVSKRGSKTIESAPMNFPIFICRGCLIFNYGTCDSPHVPDSPEPGNPCNLAQDDRVDCCQEGTLLICPAESQTTTP
jgi:hypothetical protein